MPRAKTIKPVLPALPLFKLAAKGRRTVDLSNQRFGDLVAMWPCGLSGSERRVNWTCLCEACGTYTFKRAHDLMQGKIKSCGCNQAPTIHGHSIGGKQTPEFRVYNSAKDRCNNPNNRAYKYYGARGIAFEFETFKEFFAEVGEKPEPKRKYTLERVDNDGNYCTGNLKWATMAEQSLNKRKWGTALL